MSMPCATYCSDSDIVMYVLQPDTFASTLYGWRLQARSQREVARNPITVEGNQQMGTVVEFKRKIRVIIWSNIDVLAG